MPRPVSRLTRLAIFAAVTVAAIAAAACLDPLPQNPEYHRFADVRPLLSIPNAGDVLSNIAFLVVGAYGLVVVFRTARFLDARERWPWVVMFAGVALTGAGSAWYHLAPTNASLVWDRLPMTLGFMGLLSALVAERVSVRVAIRLLGPLLLLGLGSVAYWALTEARGAGDLRPYLLVQLYPLVAILLLLALFPASYTRATDLLVALAWYAAAKATESYDREIFALLGFVSGHTLKHLFAATGAGWTARMLALRRARTVAGPAWLLSLPVACALALPAAASANAGAYFGAGGQVTPIKNEDVRLVKERVSIRPRMDGRPGKWGAPFEARARRAGARS